LAVSPSEASKALFSRFAAVYRPDAIFFRRTEGLPCPAPAAHTGRVAQAAQTMQTAPAGGRAACGAARPAARRPAARPLRRPAGGAAAAEALFRRGAYGEAAELLLASGVDSVRDPAELSLLARSLANQGRLADALLWCDRWLAQSKLDPTGHYLRAV